MKAKDERLPIWTLPNRLSVIRILFIPLIILCMEQDFPNAHFSAFLLFLIAGITDGLDGFVARRMRMTSKLGLYLDPIADKLLVSSVLITLTYENLVPLWVTILLVCREFLINGLRAFLAYEGIAVYPSFAGKLKTVLQIIGIACILFDFGSGLLRNTLIDKIGLYILYVALFFSLYSAWHYIAAIFKPTVNGKSQ
jgi:CDP-diacylglycerol---glycerol-3-phosphate 3-phosphatidyltransferase